MRVHVRHQQREIRSNTLFAILIYWNALYSIPILIPAIWINFVNKSRDTLKPLSDLDSIWYGAVLVLWTLCELPRLWLGTAGNKEHLFAPFLQFFLLNVVTLGVMFAFVAQTPRANALDTGLASVQLIFTICELVLWCFMASGMVHQNTVDFYAHLWAVDPTFNGGLGVTAAGAAEAGKGAKRRKARDGDDSDSGAEREGEDADEEMDAIPTSGSFVGGKPVLFTPRKKAAADSAEVSDGEGGGAEDAFLAHAKAFQSGRRSQLATPTRADDQVNLSQHPSAINSPSTPLSAERRRPAVAAESIPSRRSKGAAAAAAAAMPPPLSFGRQ